MEARYDVVAVGLLPENRSMVRIVDKDLSDMNAEATIRMAVYRRGVDDEFFAKVSAGKYQEGDTWSGNGITGKEA